MNATDSTAIAGHSTINPSTLSDRLDDFKRRTGLLKPMTPEELTVHMLKTYRSLRLCLLAFAVLLPVVLPLVGFTLGRISFQHSLSAYYWAGFDQPAEERAIFGGSLFAVGACLIAYRGFSNEEDWALNIAGVLVWGVALFPMRCTAGMECPVPCTGQGHGLIHGTCAVTFFVLLAYVALFRSKDTLACETTFSASVRRWFEYQYNLAAGLMIALPVLAVVLTYHPGGHPFLIIGVEWAAVWAFAYYWAVKSCEMARSQMIRRAAHHQVQAGPSGRIEAAMPQPVPIAAALRLPEQR